jgi:molecular chaperone GrpE (heat shock protein)
LGDLLLVATACVLFERSGGPLGIWQESLIVISVAAGALLAILPFVLEYRATLKLLEAESLTDVVGQIKQLELIAEQIAGATARWQGVQEVADRVAGTSKAIAERMAAEAKAFTEFMQKANDNEKAMLRLETDKLKRAESEWVHVLVRMLDHVYALHIGAVRSGQPKLIAQLDQFQHACRDAARRIGLTPFEGGTDEPFNSERHQVLEGHEAPAAGATIAETLATGYTFQGRLLRPALVRLQEENGHTGEETGKPQTGAEQSNLALGAAQATGAVKPE